MLHVLAGWRVIIFMHRQSFAGLHCDDAGQSQQMSLQSGAAVQQLPVPAIAELPAVDKLPGAAAGNVVKCNLLAGACHC